MAILLNFTRKLSGNKQNYPTKLAYTKQTKNLSKDILLVSIYIIDLTYYKTTNSENTIK